MSMESPKKGSQGTPEEIKEGDWQLTEHEMKSSIAREAIFSQQEDQDMFLDYKNGEYHLDVINDKESFSARIRGEDVRLEKNTETEEIQGWLGGQKLNPLDAEAIFYKWLPIAKEHTRMENHTSLTADEKAESLIERLTSESVAKLLA